MTWLGRVLCSALLLYCLWPEFARWQAERSLAQAGARIEAVLAGTPHDAEMVARLQRDLGSLARAGEALPGDARVPLQRGIALLLLGDAPASRAEFEAAIARGERPELVLNLGRARSALGDEAGARRAFLRSAWAAPASTATLPRALREQLASEVARLEVDLRAGRIDAAPALD